MPPTIRDITRAAYARWVPVIGREPLPMAVDYDSAVREHRFDLLRRGGDTLALIETMLREDHLWIENIAVRPDAQGQGLGRIAAEPRRRDGTRQRACASYACSPTPHSAAMSRCTSAAAIVVTEREAFRGGMTVHMRKSLMG